MTTTELKSDRVCGEAPTVLILSKEFNVLCVTKRHSKAQEKRMKDADIVTSTEWHQPITGKALLEVIGVQMGDITVPAEIRITFNGVTCKFLYFRTGLGGTSHGIGIEAPEQREYHDVWDLYTDEPTEKGLQLGIGSQAPSSHTNSGGHIFGGIDPAYKDAQPGLVIKALG